LPLFLPKEIMTQLYLDKIPDGIGISIIIIGILTIVYLIICFIIFLYKIITTFVKDIFGHKKDDEYFYNALISDIYDLMILDRWEIFTLYILSGKIEKKFIYNQENINKLILGTIWIKKFRKIKKYILNLFSAYNNFINTYIENAVLYDDEIFDCREMQKNKVWWEKVKYELLYFTFSLNKLIEEINMKFNQVGTPDKLKKRFLLQEMNKNKKKYIIFYPVKMKKYKINKKGEIPQIEKIETENELY
jgi:hypothetical protein